MCHSVGHSLFVFNWLCLDSGLYFAFTGGTEMSSSLVLFRGEALSVCPLVIPYTGRTISVSLLVLTRAHPD